MTATDLINNIEYELRKKRATTAPWPPKSGHDLNIYNDCEALRALVAPPPPPVPDPGKPPVPVGAILFSDDFNGTTIDTTKWEGKHFRAPSGTQWDYLNHATLDGNGNLVITAKVANGQWYSTFLAGLAANGHSYKGPRYVEARAKVPAGNGCFAAPIWEWAAPWGAGPVEIDVAEQLGKEPFGYHTTVHPWLPAGDHPVGHSDDVGTVLSADFHVYGAAVYPSKVDFYFDGAFVWSADMSASGLGDLTQYPVVPCIDLDMGGWGGPVDPSITEASMLVDYFRAWALA